MELISLRTFEAVVEEGGVLSASRKLNTVQSNVTARIKRLEEELGVELFYRKGRGLELAPAGRVLLNYSRQLLQLEANACAAVRQVGEQSGELRLGTMETFAALHLPAALKALRQTHPGIDLRIYTETSAALIDQVLDHKLDCAFVGGAVEHPDLQVVEIQQVELVKVSSRQAGEDLTRLVLFHEGCAYRSRVLAWQQECGQQNTEIMEMGTLDGILGCVAVGLGSTLLPRWAVEQSRYREDLLIEALPERLALMPLVMVRRVDSVPLKVLDTLVAVAKARVPELTMEQCA